MRACGTLEDAVLIPELPYEKARSRLAVHVEERVRIDEGVKISNIIMARTAALMCVVSSASCGGRADLLFVYRVLAKQAGMPVAVTSLASFLPARES